MVLDKTFVAPPRSVRRGPGGDPARRHARRIAARPAGRE